MISKIIESPLKKHFIFLIVLSSALSLYTALFGHMNNWLIFRSSFFHLIDGLSLYQLYPNEHDDLFKYSPTFALLMAPLSVLPPVVGALAWNLLGTFLFIIAIFKLPVTSAIKKGIFWVSLPEFIGSTQGFQSNIHMVSLLFLFWILMEEKATLKGATLLPFSFLIKIFGIIGAALFTFSEYSTRNLKFFLIFLSANLASLIVLLLVPLIVVTQESLFFQYSEWLRLLKEDASLSYGFSLMGFLHRLTGSHINILWVQIAGALSLLTSFLYFRKGDQQARLMGLIAICYFMVVFNHKSESPTFIIPMMAFGVHQGLIKDKVLRWALIVFTLTCVSLLYADPFRAIRLSHIDFYCVKVWPFLVLYPMALFHWANKNTCKIN